MKPTQAILRQRIDEVYSIRVDGATIHDVRRYVAEKETAGEAPWTLPAGGRPVSERTLWRYIEKTDHMMAETCRETQKRRLRRHLAMRRNLAAKAIAQGDIRAALAVLDSEAKLTGLFEHELNRMVEKLATDLAELKASYGNSHAPKTTDGDASGVDRDPPAGDAGSPAATG